MNRRNFLIAALIACSVPVCAQQYPYQNIKLSAEQRAEDLCNRLSSTEKISLMMNGSVAIPRLGIPEFEWWSEALHGVGRNGFATVFPITTAMAASWDDILLYRVFCAVSDEARAKNNLAKKAGSIGRYQGLSFWTPNINIFRDPRWGRGQETYGEDPYLTSRMGLAVVRGLQGFVPAASGNGWEKASKYYKLLACAKHFAVHSGPEWNRHTFNIENLPARDLWETYLPAFKSLVEEGDVREVMCAYQRFDGSPCCGNNRLLQQILRNDWHFKGLVVSDCGAIGDFWIKGRHEVSADAPNASAKAVIAGTDVECGANYKSLPQAISSGLISEQKIDESIRRLIIERINVGDLDPDSDVEWTHIPASVIANAEHKQLAYKMALESMTLLQNNDGILPLKKNGQRIVVMGPNANDSIMQWGNYTGYPTETTTILEGIRDKIGNVRYIKACGLTRNEVLESRFDEITDKNGNPGMTATYWNNTDMSGAPVATANMLSGINLSNGGNTVFCPGVNLEHFSARFEGTYIPRHSEDVEFNMAFDDCARLIINGDTVYEYWKPRARVWKGSYKLNAQAGKKYNVVVEYLQNTDMAVMNFDINHRTASDVRDVVSQAKDADVVVFVGGISPYLEGEEMKVSEPGFKGGDRTDIELPLPQRDIIAALHNAGKKVVFVNCSGGAVGLEPESHNAAAILQAWYPGEQGGKAVADVLFGDFNPSGKLPVTFYRNVSQLPDFLDYDMKGRTYRYFKGSPLFPFGYGLSYSLFNFGKPKYVNGRLYVNITNSGKYDGDETVQVYIRRIADTDGPLKTLKAFKRVNVKAGQKISVEVDMPRESFEVWDASTNTMRVLPGKYEVLVGKSSADNDLRKIVVQVK
jgi:beta-glucosidase